MDTRTLYSFSDLDEIGIAAAQVEVAGRLIDIYDLHPDGSDTAKLVFAKTLLADSQGRRYVIALGDTNLPDSALAYKLIHTVYAEAWTSVYPSAVSPDGVDMSGNTRIDHIFLSHTLGVKDPIYLLPPLSATDHPVHWAEVFWENP